jgi:RNA polymerase sigma-70 factor (ECF subfamily)
MSAEDERRLIVEAQEGSTRAFRIIVERYMKRAYDIAYSVVRDHEEAEDVAQEAFVRVYRSLHTFRGDSQFGTWLYRVVTNHALNRIERNQNRIRLQASLTGSAAMIAAASEPPAEQDETKPRIERALYRLPTLQRAVVILRHMNGLSTRQVSEILRCSEGTVKTHLHRGLKKMKTMLDPE